VVVDTVTSFQDIVLKELMKLDEIKVQLNWGTVPEDVYRQRAEKVKEHLRLFKDLAKHVVFIGKEKDHNAQKGDRTPKMIRGLHSGSFISTDLGGSAAGWINDCCDYICRLTVEDEMEEVVRTVGTNEIKTVEPTGKSKRYLRTTMTPNIAAGFRSARPDKLPEVIEEPTFEKIYRAIKGE